jgi:hypothetical protein
MAKIKRRRQRKRQEARAVIRDERGYKEALSRLEKDREVVRAQRQVLVESGFSEEEVERALGPMLSFHAQLEEEVEWYERVRRRAFTVSRGVRDIGRTLIALRIARHEP